MSFQWFPTSSYKQFSLFSLLGGLSAVMYTDAAQTVIMLGGAVVLMILCKHSLNCTAVGSLK